MSKKVANKIFILLFALLVLIVGFKKLDFFQDYGSTVIVETNYFFDKQEKELLKGNKVVGEFKANNNNLGIIAANFDTHNKINNDYLQFSIKEKGKNNWYYSNKYKVDQFQNNKYFPFGFPEIKNSKNIIYQIEIESLNGIDSHSVKITPKSTPFLVKYSFPKTYLLQNKKEIPLFLLAKIKSFFTHIRLIEYFWIIFSSFIFYVLLRFINFNKLLIFLKKRFKTSTKNNLFFSKLSKNKRLRFLLILISLIVIFIINWKVNGQIKLKVLVLDDLSSWNFFNENKDNFFGFIFNTVANKFRPVFNLVFFCLFKLFGQRLGLFKIFNLVFNFLIGALLFFLFKKISKNIIVSFCLSVIFIVSRFAYYNIGQALGVMEAMALVFATLLLFWLWRFLNKQKIKYFWFSLIAFAMLIFTHERYVTFLGLYFVAFLMLGFNKHKNIWLFLLSSIPVIINFVLKMFVFKIRAFDGTGGTSIIETFNFFNFKNLFFSGWLYLLGINDGPAYLNGISKEVVPLNINILISIGILCLFIFLILFVFFILKINNKISKKYFANFVLFFSFIFFSLIAASVTIRLEMRWLYTPLVGLLFLLVYIYGTVRKQNTLVKIGFVVIIIWTGVTIPIELFYRTYYKNIYFWGYQTLTNSFYEATLEKYGNNFWNYKTYIICSNTTSPFMLSCNDHGDINLLFKQFENKNIKSKIFLLDDISKIELNNKNELILVYDQQQSKFVELKIGSDLREAKLKNGWYGWDSEKKSIWIEKKAEALFLTGNDGNVIFQGYIPEYNLPNKLSIYANDKLVFKTNVSNSNFSFKFKVPKNKFVNLKISVDHVKSPLEVGVNSDVRKLGILVKDVIFE